MSIKKYEDLVNLAQQQRDEKIRLKASCDATVETIKSLGYKNLLEAKKGLSDKIAERDKKVIEYNEKLQVFEEKYGHLLQKKDNR